MTTLLDKLKLLLGISTADKDTLLSLLLDMSEEFCCSYTNREAEDIENCILQVAVYNYNKLGSEGLESESYSGASFTYSNDYPDSILNMLKSKKKLVTL